MEFLHSDAFLIVVLSINIAILILFILNYIKTNKMRKYFYTFSKKLGKGENISEMLKEYIKRTEKIENENEEIKDFLLKLNNRTQLCFQKTGMVRYNAFKDTGSNLSFALAILDNENNGIVLNGIYARDVSNIYAKPVVKGKSEYKLSEEEEEAIAKAIHSKK